MLWKQYSRNEGQLAFLLPYDRELRDEDYGYHKHHQTQTETRRVDGQYTDELTA